MNPGLRDLRGCWKCPRNTYSSKWDGEKTKTWTTFLTLILRTIPGAIRLAKNRVSSKKIAAHRHETPFHQPRCAGKHSRSISSTSGHADMLAELLNDKLFGKHASALSNVG